MIKTRMRSVMPPVPIAKAAVAVAMAAASMVVVAADAPAAAATESTFKFDGYVRGEFSWNMKNWEDTANYDDKGKDVDGSSHGTDQYRAGRPSRT